MGLTIYEKHRLMEQEAGEIVENLYDRKDKLRQAYDRLSQSKDRAKRTHTQGS